MEWGRFVWGTVPVSAVEGVGWGAINRRAS